MDAALFSYILLFTTISPYLLEENHELSIMTPLLVIFFFYFVFNLLSLVMHRW